MRSTLFLAAVVGLATPAIGDSIQILDFTAAWCKPCQTMRPELERLKRQGYPIREIDIDKSPRLAERFGVEAVPTFIVVDESGNELGRLSGARPAEELARLYDSALAKREESAAGSLAREPGTTRAEPTYKPWETVVRIKVLNHLARPRGTVGYGSGTIIYSDEQESIILTCAHIFHVEELRSKVPPAKFPLKVRVDLFDGKLSGGETPQVRTTEVDIPAEVIDYDFAGDVGLIRIRPGRKLPYSRVVAPGWEPRPKMQLTTMGCSGGKDATAWTTYVTRTLIRLQTPNGLYDATECSSPPMQGRSGGGLFTLDGLVAGVCDFNDGPRGEHGLYASPRTIHRLLDKNRLQICYDDGAARRRGADTMLADRGTRGSKILGQNPPEEFEVPLPSPEILNVRLPADAETGDGYRSYRWRPGPDSPQAALASVRIAVPSEASDEAILPRAASLRREPAADADLFANAPAFPADSGTREQDLAPLRILPEKTLDAWKPATRTSSGRAE